MRATPMFVPLGLRFALPTLALSVTSCQNCSQPTLQEDYFGPKFFLAAGTDPPPSPNPRPRPPPPLPPVQRPPPGTQPASDALWDRAGAKGCTLGWAMQATDHDAGALYVPVQTTAQSAYGSTKDLEKWFWSAFPRERLQESFYDLYATWGIGWALKELGVSEYTTEYEGGKNILLNIAHESYLPTAPQLDQQWYQVDDNWYPATGASYSFTINPSDGIIIALNRQSPKWAAKDRNPPIPPAQLPHLNQFSDIAWITWKAMHNPPYSRTRLTPPKYFLSASITNTETQQIIQRALEANNWALAAWPGHVFDKNWPETKALLGSPNLQGFAYFLIQHKAELGAAYVERVRVFRGETRAEWPCVLVYVRWGEGRGVAVRANL